MHDHFKKNEINLKLSTLVMNSNYLLNLEVMTFFIFCSKFSRSKSGERYSYFLGLGKYVQVMEQEWRPMSFGATSQMALRFGQFGWIFCACWLNSKRHGWNTFFSFLHFCAHLQLEQNVTKIQKFQVHLVFGIYKTKCDLTLLVQTSLPSENHGMTNESNLV